MAKVENVQNRRFVKDANKSRQPSKYTTNNNHPRRKISSLMTEINNFTNDNLYNTTKNSPTTIQSPLKVGQRPE